MNDIVISDKSLEQSLGQGIREYSVFLNELKNKLDDISKKDTETVSIEIPGVGPEKIYSILECLPREGLSKENKSILECWINNTNILQFGKELLGKVYTISNNLTTVNKKSFEKTLALLEWIFLGKLKGEFGDYSCDINKKTINILDGYKGYNKLDIIVDQEEKNIYLGEENFKVNSYDWKQIDVEGITMKINEYDDIMERVDSGEQFFTFLAAKRELRRQKKRLPRADLINPEFQAIVGKVGLSIFKKDYSVYYWAIASDGVSPYAMTINSSGKYAFHRADNIKDRFFSIRAVLD